MDDFPFNPFRIINNRIIVPDKYIELFDETSFPASEESWAQIRARLVTSYWLNHWYDDSLSVITPKTEFIPLEAGLPCYWSVQSAGKFVRLTSLSTKEQLEPVWHFDDDDRDALLANPRIRSSLDIARIAKVPDEEVQIAFRDWVDLSSGTEWRVFVWEEEIKCIGLNDANLSSMTNSEVITRCKALWEGVRFHAPVVDCVMDVWLSNDRDIVIEFNSYGFWGQSTAGLFDWKEDAVLLYNPKKADIIVRR